MKFLVLLICSVTYAQITVRVGDITISNDAAVSLRSHLLTSVVRDAGRLQARINQTTVNLVVTGNPPAVNDAISVDSEIMLVTAVSGQQITVTRGHLQTQATVHGAMSMVSVLKYSNLREFVRLSLVDIIADIIDKNPPPAVKTFEDAIRTAEEGKRNIKRVSVQ